MKFHHYYSFSPHPSLFVSFRALSQACKMNEGQSSIDLMLGWTILLIASTIYQNVLCSLGSLASLSFAELLVVNRSPEFSLLCRYLSLHTEQMIKRELESRGRDKAFYMEREPDVGTS